jgi:hypothetical protein
MNQLQGVRRTFHKVLRAFTAGTLTLGLGLGLMAGAVNIHAQTSFVWTNTAPTGIWQDNNAWLMLPCDIVSSNTCGTGSGNGFPGFNVGGGGGSAADEAIFTNAQTYYISFNSTLNVLSNIFDNLSNTLATVTLDVGAHEFEVNTQFTCGDARDSTSVVYIASNTINDQGTIGFFMPGGSGTGMSIGRNGHGTLNFTNGNASVGAVSIGAGLNGVGTLVVSGPSTTFQFGNGSGGFAVANNSNSFGNTVIITNGATLRNIANGTFRFGSGSGQGGTASNMFTIVAGGKLILGTGTITIGNGATGTFPGSFDNTMIIGSGGTFFAGGDKDGATHTLFLGTSKGTPATNNVLRILTGGQAYSISQLLITPSNTLDMAGGQYGGVLSNSILNLGGVVTNQGLVQGYGTFLATLNIASNAQFSTFNSLGSMVFSNSLNILSNSIVQIQVGSTMNPTKVTSNLQVRGNSTLNIVDSGGLANGTYTIVTNLCNCTNQISFEAFASVTGPAPFSYQVVNTSNAINLVVSGGGSGLPFQITSITRSGNDVTVNWNTSGSNGQTNFVQASSGPNYPGAFMDIATNIIAGTTASYTDVGGASASPNRYYRVRSPQ